MNFDKPRNYGIIIFIVSILIISNNEIFGDRTYTLNIDDHSFEIKYDFEGEVIAMAIDKELTSLLIGIENVRDSQFRIEFSNELIDATDNYFIVLVNGVEVNYEIIPGQNKILVFFIPVFTEEIEIIGTQVVSEFPFGASLTLVSIITVIVIYQKVRTNFK